MSEWQPIETAPRDGTVILALRFYPVAIRWTGHHEWQWEAIHLGGAFPLLRNAYVVNDVHLTHWMPLPEPPK